MYVEEFFIAYNLFLFTFLDAVDLNNVSQSSKTLSTQNPNNNCICLQKSKLLVPEVDSHEISSCNWSLFLFDSSQFLVTQNKCLVEVV